MPTFHIELMTQINQFFEPPTSSFRGHLERCTTCLPHPEHCTRDRHMNESPCSSSGTLVSEEDFHLQAQAHKLADDQDQETVSEDIRSSHIFAPQPRKSEFNPNAAPFVPLSSTILFSSPAPTLVNVRQTWQDLLYVGSSTTEPSQRFHFARLLAASDRWTFSALRHLAEHFCWISTDYEHTASCPGSTALFAQAVRDAVTSADSEWEPTCFTSQLKEYALDYFKSYWSSIVRSLTVPPDDYSPSQT